MIYKIISLSVLACVLSACQQSETNTTTQSTATNNDTNTNKTVYYVSSEMSKVPMVMHDGSGMASGFEAELLQSIAESQGFTVKYNIDSWEGLFKNLDSDNTNILVGSITITDERRERMDFTQPVLAYQTGIMVQPELSKVKSFNELRGQKVNLRKNTVYEKMVPIFSVGEGENIVYPETVWEQVRSLISKQSDAMVGASVTLEYYQNQYTDHNFHIVYENNAPKSYYGWAVKKGDTILLNKLNAGLEQAKQDGTYERLYKKYWPNVPYQLP
ncbi:transporter substrate-binding domain-containing protein [Wielerella bovis]|uniref:ABC transporter substrate-binding protein n=1 Tax=Wielerella bovis TaxID=2917790 RepID=UPI0020189CAB|nr:transporter substrate-binding domain-containing protein [Wielerella bovis]ULJ65634.1 transporter substrate-binding domain-containing protein [Wielerella bovis]ULJ66322.1 transporter substrate-binding domain-containing protein [Wielerella bovis]